MRACILVLHDGPAACERVDTADVLVEAAHVAEALEGLGYAPAVASVDLDLRAVDRLLERHAPIAVFNLVEALGGRAELIQAVPALLEARGVPFTGCSAYVQHLTSNKLLAKHALAAARIRTPPLFDGAPAAAGRWIVKSVWEHASFGIDDGSIVAAHDVPAALTERARRYGGRWFAEAYVPGREFNVALLTADGDVVTLPPAEIRFDGFPADKPHIVGYAAKWLDASFEYGATPRSFDVEPALATALGEIARACWHLFGLAGYARVDFRVGAGGAIHVLEVNSNPCLSADAGFAAALARGGVGFDRAVEAIVRDALRRADPTAYTGGVSLPQPAGGFARCS